MYTELHFLDSTVLFLIFFIRTTLVLNPGSATGSCGTMSLALVLCFSPSILPIANYQDLPLTNGTNL